MKRWNGWGNVDTDYPVPLPAIAFLTKGLGQLELIPDPARETLLSASATDLVPIPATPYFWSEFRPAARAEGVEHLDDLLLRRVRLGLLAPNGGIDLLPRHGPTRA